MTEAFPLACSPSPIGNLPPELLSHIFALLPPAALCTAQLVNRDWNHIISDEGAWRVSYSPSPLSRPCREGRKFLLSGLGRVADVVGRSSSPPERV